MSPAALTLVPGEVSTAQRAATLTERAREEAAAAAEEAYVLAEQAALRLWEVSKLDMAPAGVRDGCKRLSQQISADVVRMSALAARARAS